MTRVYRTVTYSLYSLSATSRASAKTFAGHVAQHSCCRAVCRLEDCTNCTRLYGSAEPMSAAQ